MAGNSQQEPDLPQDFDLPQVPPYAGTLVKWGAAVIGLILLFALLSFLKSIYTDWLWYGSLGLRSVYVKVLVTRVALFIVGAAVVAAGLVVSLYFANRQSEGPPAAAVAVAPEALAFLKRLVFWGRIGVVVILSAVFGAIMAAHWEIFLRFANSVPFGETDPVFGKARGDRLGQALEPPGDPCGRPAPDGTGRPPFECGPEREDQAFADADGGARDRDGRPRA